jgi:Inosine-uridine preferring nucleoside hydrolase
MRWRSSWRCASDVHVAGITVVWGNVPVEQGVRNALYVTELCGMDVPVHQGAARPLGREPSNAKWFHGKQRAARGRRLAAGGWRLGARGAGLQPRRASCRTLRIDG